jgi:hypothetical protein
MPPPSGEVVRSAFMRYLPFISAGFWIDGCGAGIVIGLAIASHIEGRGIWGYAPALFAVLLPLVALVITVVRVTAAQSEISSEQSAPRLLAALTPEPAALVLAWKPLINGWDIVLGRQVTESAGAYTHWLPVPPRPE